MPVALSPLLASPVLADLAQWSKQHIALDMTWVCIFEDSSALFGRVLFTPEGAQSSHDRSRLELHSESDKFVGSGNADHWTH